MAGLLLTEVATEQRIAWRDVRSAAVGAMKPADPQEFEVSQPLIRFFSERQNSLNVEAKRGPALECQPMKKGMLVLWLVGAAIYSVDTLLITGPKSPSSQNPAVEHPPTDQVANRPLSSWDPYLRGHGPKQPSSQPVSSTISARIDDHQHAPLPETPADTASDHSAPLTTEDASSDSAEANWIKVILPAKLHSAADISSPIVNYYPPGTVLRAVSARDAWVAVVNPATNTKGWILEQYLSSTGSPEQVRRMEQDEPQTTVQKVAPLPNISPPLTGPASNTDLAEWEPPSRPTYQRRHRRLGLLGLFRRF